jgi:hypothetical protein
MSSLINAVSYLAFEQSSCRIKWRRLIARMNPGKDPLGKPAKSLAAVLGKDLQEVRNELARDTRALSRLTNWSNPPGKKGEQKLLLVVDQFEELFRLFETNERGELPPRKMMLRCWCSCCWQRLVTGHVLCICF